MTRRTLKTVFHAVTTALVLATATVSAEGRTDERVERPSHTSDAAGTPIIDRSQLR